MRGGDAIRAAVQRSTAERLVGMLKPGATVVDIGSGVGGTPQTAHFTIDGGLEHERVLDSTTGRWSIDGQPSGPLTVADDRPGGHVGVSDDQYVWAAGRATIRPGRTSVYRQDQRDACLGGDSFRSVLSTGRLCL
jgi:hypothetical protein